MDKLVPQELPEQRVQEGQLVRMVHLDYQVLQEIQVQLGQEE